MPRQPARHCSVDRALSILGEPWSFLVLRAPFFGIRRFEEMQRSLGVARSILAARLHRLVDHGILEKAPYALKPPRFEYRLSEKGLDLYPSILAMMAWGDRWMAKRTGPPLVLTHAACGAPLQPVVACSSCDGAIDARAVRYRDGPGAGRSAPAADRRRRRISEPAAYDRGRPCAVARTLKILGDHWTFLILREAFFGHRRFDHMRAELGIAGNILSDRIGILTRAAIFDRRLYQERPPRYEYCLTPRGLDLYGSIITLMRWGDRWLAGDAGPPLILTHTTCGKDFDPVVICPNCGGALSARQVRYADGPGAATRGASAPPSPTA